MKTNNLKSLIIILATMLFSVTAIIFAVAFRKEIDNMKTEDVLTGLILIALVALVVGLHKHYEAKNKRRNELNTVRKHRQIQRY